MARVVVENLAKIFINPGGERVRAVDNARLHAEDQELLALIGPSGCGKTTLLRLIAGLETPDAGTISLDGTIVNGVEPKDRDVAMVFQSHALYPHMTARENLAFGLKLRKTPAAEIERRIGGIAEMLGIAGCLARRPAELSGGQRQRVALGRALVRRPKLLLLDEPFAHLDSPLRRELRRELLALHRELGLTTILVTHDQIEATTLGERIAVMNRGTIEQMGPPADVQARPATPFVAAFLDGSVV
jgi:multiple sugar transport system ATP-binding protein